MVALFLTTTITCSQAFDILNKIKSNNSILDIIKTELIETIRESIPYCPVTIKKMDDENQTDKWNRGLTLFEESVLKPDPELRNCAHNQKCYNELMSVREYVLEYLKTLRK